jgi:crossover junction endodeoxyribonuclease RuvC
MIILGLDPGTARLGYGVIEIREANKHAATIKYVQAGCLTTAMETAMGERLLYLSVEIGKILEKYRPDVAAVEQLFFGINSRTAMAVGQARGVILATLAKHKVPTVVEYQGLAVKFALTGFGRSDKKAMQESVRKHLKMKEIIKPDDAADGLALAITHFIKSQKA